MAGKLNLHKNGQRLSIEIKSHTKLLLKAKKESKEEDDIPIFFNDGKRCSQNRSKQ